MGLRQSYTQAIAKRILGGSQLLRVTAGTTQCADFEIVGDNYDWREENAPKVANCPISTSACPPRGPLPVELPRRKAEGKPGCQCGADVARLLTKPCSTAPPNTPDPITPSTPPKPPAPEGMCWSAMEAKRLTGLEYDTIPSSAEIAAPKMAPAASAPVCRESPANSAARREEPSEETPAWLKSDMS